MVRDIVYGTCTLGMKNRGWDLELANDGSVPVQFGGNALERLDRRL